MSRPSGEGVAARRAALEVVGRVEEDGAFANLVAARVTAAHGLSGADAALATDLAYGTVRLRRALDHALGRFLREAPPPSAGRALRLGAYQILERRDVPAYAAVSSTVAAAPSRHRGLVNAVLRRLSEDPGEPAADPAVALSYPDWVVDRLVGDLGRERALAALAAMNLPAVAHRRPDGYVQDPASQMVVAATGAGPGEVVADLCAAPGGKATGMAAAGAHVVAADRSAPRIGLVEANVARLGATGVVPVLADAAAPPLRPASLHRVLLDAPCSGLGVLRRRPDARWRVDAEAPERLAGLQRRMVDAAVPLLRPGGTLVYSVCTLTAVETTGVDDHVAEVHPDLLPAPPTGPPWVPWGRGALLLPAAEHDGMALFRWRAP